MLPKHFRYITRAGLKYAQSCASASLGWKRYTLIDNKAIDDISSMQKIILCKKTKGPHRATVRQLFLVMSSCSTSLCNLQSFRNEMPHLEHNLFFFLLIKTHMLGAWSQHQLKGEHWMERGQRKLRSAGTRRPWKTGIKCYLLEREKCGHITQ